MKQPPRFQSAAHLVETHGAMFGDLGERCARLLLTHAQTLFHAPIDPLGLRVVAAPVEMAPYDNHAGYVMRSAGLILMNRHLCEVHGGALVATDAQALEDFVVHELTHIRQAQLLAGGSIKVNRTRGAHRDQGWYGAISEAAPKYLGVSFPPSMWPRWKSVRVRDDSGKSCVAKERVDGTLDEPTVTHWPETFRALARTGQLKAA